MNGGPSGFHNAPVAKTLVVVATALFTVPFGIQGRSLKLGLSYEDVYQKLQIWKLISSVFAFKSTPELIFGLCLLYYFRVFERQIGSNKYSVFILFSVVVPLLFQIVALGYLKDPSLNPLASGPYGLIFASYVPFFFDIPISSRFRIFGLHLSDKSFIYLAGLQVNTYMLTCLSSACVRSFMSIATYLFACLSLASLFILETINSPWHLWHSCWILVSPKLIWHPKTKGCNLDTSNLFRKVVFNDHVDMLSFFFFLLLFFLQTRILLSGYGSSIGI